MTECRITFQNRRVQKKGFSGKKGFGNKGSGKKGSGNKGSGNKGLGNKGIGKGKSNKKVETDDSNMSVGDLWKEGRDGQDSGKDTTDKGKVQNLWEL